MNDIFGKKIGGCLTDYALRSMMMANPGMGKTLGLPLPFCRPSDFELELELEPETRKCGHCVTKQCCIICGKCDGCDC